MDILLTGRERERVAEAIKEELIKFASIHFPPNQKYNGNVIFGLKREVTYGDCEKRDVIGSNFFSPTTKMQDTMGRLYHPRKDIYLTANTFIGDKRCAEDLFACNNLVLDIDAHGFTENMCVNAGTLFSQFYLNLVDVFADRNLPLPNTIVYTGRGMQLWWAVEQVSFKLEDLYADVKQYLADVIREIIRDNPVYEYLWVDEGASSNDSGFFRVPGSFNTKVGRYGTFQVIHDRKINLFDFSDEYLTALRFKSRRKYVDAAGGFGAVARKRVEAIKALIELRNKRGSWENEGYRDLALFIAFNDMLTYLDTDQAWQELMSINRMFRKPMPESEVRSRMKASVRKGGYSNTNQRIARILSISEAEQREIGYSFTSSAKRPKSHHNYARVSDEKTGYVLLQAGEMLASEIAKNISISPSTVKRIIASENKLTLAERRKNRAFSMMKKGIRPSEIARKLGTARSTVYRWLNEMNEKTRKRAEAAKAVIDAKKQVQASYQGCRSAGDDIDQAVETACTLAKKQDLSINVRKTLSEMFEEVKQWMLRMTEKEKHKPVPVVDKKKLVERNRRKRRRERGITGYAPNYIWEG